MDVLHVMLSNNLGVKKCFVPMFKSGNVAPRIDVRIELQPTGNVTSTSVRQAEYQGSTLESCLGTAISAIAFPPYAGAPQAITYPFVLK